MDVEYIFIIIGAILALWLAGLTALYVILFAKLKKVITETKGGTILSVFESVLASEKKNKKEIDQVKAELEKVSDNSVFHIQKLSLVRFNPFNETGGDHSFSMAMLNGKDTGVVITGLHTRERTRLYVKPISRGKSEYELSLEEKKAIAKAQRS
jgi:hypothetical protein